MQNQDKHSLSCTKCRIKVWKIWNFVAFVCVKTWLCLKQRPGGGHSIRSLQARKLTVDGRLLLRFHDAVSVGRWLHALQPLTLAVVSARALGVVEHARVYSTTVFCLVFGKKFNIMSAIFVHQSLTLPQKIDSHEGWFWCKKWVVCAYGKMNIYFKEPPFAPFSGLFAAK